MNRRKLLGRCLPLLTSLAVSLALSACSKTSPAQFKARDITGSSIGGDFELSDHSGQIRNLASFQGKLLVIFFGFANCPDVCPTTLYALAQVIKALGPDANSVQIAMITVDPDRDTQQVMSAYVTAFNPSFLGLVPTEKSLNALSDQFKLVINRNKPNVSGFYTVDHTAAAFVFDRQGRIRLFVPHPHDLNVADLADDLRILLHES